MKKNIMKHLTRTLALALALILTVGAFPTAKAAGNEDWMNNVTSGDYQKYYNEMYEEK